MQFAYKPRDERRLKHVHVCQLRTVTGDDDLLFGAWGLGFFVPHKRNFRSYGEVTITDEGLQILTYDLWSLGSEVSLACQPTVKRYDAG